MRPERLRRSTYYSILLFEHCYQCELHSLFEFNFLFIILEVSGFNNLPINWLQKSILIRLAEFHHSVLESVFLRGTQAQLRFREE